MPLALKQPGDYKGGHFFRTMPSSTAIFMAFFSFVVLWLALRVEGFTSGPLWRLPETLSKRKCYCVARRTSQAFILLTFYRIYHFSSDEFENHEPMSKWNPSLFELVVSHHPPGC